MFYKAGREDESWQCILKNRGPEDISDPMVLDSEVEQQEVPVMAQVEGVSGRYPSLNP